MNEGLIACDRLRGMLIKDKLDMSDGFLSALNNDLVRILSQYFRLKNDNCKIIVDIDSDNNYVVKINTSADFIKHVKTI